jgi:hypothetical protein
MRITVLSILLVVAAATAQAGEFVTMPAWLQARWECSLKGRVGWNDRGHDTSCWRPVRWVPGRFPEWMKPERQSLHSFVWSPKNPPLGDWVYVRRSVWLPGQIRDATVQVQADDQFQFYVNGLPLGRNDEAHASVAYDVSDRLTTGQNVLALQARDVQPPAHGLLVVPEITQSWPLDDGGWQCSTDGRRWQRVARDENPRIALEGLEPFACISVPGGMKEFATAIFRRTVAIDGVPLEAGAVILADDSYELRVNGTLVAVEKRLEKAYLPREVSLARYLLPGQIALTV